VLFTLVLAVRRDVKSERIATSTRRLAGTVVAASLKRSTRDIRRVTLTDKTPGIPRTLTGNVQLEFRRKAGRPALRKARL